MTISPVVTAVVLAGLLTACDLPREHVDASGDEKRQWVETYIAQDLLLNDGGTLRISSTWEGECVLLLKEVVNFPGGGSMPYVYRVPLAALAPDQIRAIRYDPLHTGERASGEDWAAVQLSTRMKKRSISSYGPGDDTSPGSDDAVTMFDHQIPIGDPALTDRLAQALTELATDCGAESEPY